MAGLCTRTVILLNRKNGSNRQTRYSSRATASAVALLVVSRFGFVDKVIYKSRFDAIIVARRDER